MNSGRRAAWILSGLLLLFAAVLAGMPFIGLEPITPQRLLNHDVRATEIFWQLRLPRVLAGALAGMVLAGAGMTFQALFRNPLATPFTLGTASGASLGAGLYLALGWTWSLAGFSGLTLFAFLGALSSLGLIYAFSLRRGGISTETMLLAGVVLAFFCSSLILLLQYVTNQAHSLRILRWLMGGLDVVGFRPVLEPLPFCMAGLGMIFFMRHDLNLLSMGEEIAAGRGLDVNRAKVLLLAGAGLMVGAVVAVAGPVGFVGMIVPHVCRLLLGPDHRHLAPATLLLGGAFLPLCDALARTAAAPAELPVGIITALLGGPFFMWLLFNSDARRRGEPGAG